MKSVVQDIREKLDEELARFEADGEDLYANHEFIANFVGLDDVLFPAYERLIALGCSGGRPDGSGWIYMHVMRPLNRDSVLLLTKEFDDVALSTGCLFELIDVTPTSGPRAGQCIILGICDDEAFGNAFAQ